MLVVCIYDVALCAWDYDVMKWVGTEPCVVDLMNETIPDTVHRVETAFLEGGAEGLVLAAAQRVFGDYLKVLIKTPPSVPPEIPGVVY